MCLSCVFRDSKNEWKLNFRLFFLDSFKLSTGTSRTLGNKQDKLDSSRRGVTKNLLVILVELQRSCVLMREGTQMINHHSSSINLSFMAHRVCPDRSLPSADDSWKLTFPWVSKALRSSGLKVDLLRRLWAHSHSTTLGQLFKCWSHRI